MAWLSLGTRIEGMPTVLAGPILRKVTETSVTVWLALKEPATITLTILESDVAIAQQIGTGVATAVKVGPNLYIVAVTANTVLTTLKLGKLYFYRLSFATTNGTKDLIQATGAKDPTAFAYAPYQLPSFLLPPNNIEQVRFALGSCRKTHTPGPDALAVLDDLLSTNISSPSTRPQILMFGGDQIYADEVAETLLMMLTDAGLTLLGSEELPISNALPISPTMLPPGTRTKIIKGAGFTSDDTRSHLMGLGEYLAMYLFVWSDVLWNHPQLGVPMIPDVEDVLALVKNEADLAAAKKLRQLMISQRSSILSTYSTLPRIRRALANIAVYMILDDHEITDDFNMQRRFCDGVYGNPLGMRVVQNGLIAYALCQHWGNCPDQFTGSTPGAQLLKLFDSAIHGYADFARNPILQRIVGLHTPAQLANRTPYAVYHDTDSLIYNYTIEGGAFQLIVTDTRTWRAFPRRGPLSPPDLIQETQFAAQIGATPALGNRLLMVLVTTNMPSCPSIRQAGRDVPGFPGHKYDFEDFFDGWQIEQTDFARMIVAITKKVASAGAMSPFANRVVVLSGDVHSSQVTRLGYWADQQVGDPVTSPTPARVVFAQIVASALHNQNEATIGEHQDGYGYLPGFAAQQGRQDVLLTEGFVGWNSVVIAKGTQVGTRTTVFPTAPGAGVGGVVFPVNGSATLPVMFDPDRPTQTTRREQMGAIWIKGPIHLTVAPHYRYRLDYLRRTDAGFAFSMAANGTTPLANQAAALITYASGYVPGGAEQIGISNIGELTFVKGSRPDWTARFMVRWGGITSNRWARFDVSLDPNDSAYSQLPDPI